MSRFFIILLLLVALASTSGCQTLLSDRTFISGSGILGSEERHLPTFSAIRVASNVDVTFTRGEEQQVIAHADDNVLPYLRTTVEGDTLVVDLHADSGGGLSLRNVRYSPAVEVTAPDVVELALTSSGDLTADRLVGDHITLHSSSSGTLGVGTIEGDEISVRISSSGDIAIARLEATDLDVELSSSGELTVNGGQVQRQEVTVSSSGNYEAGDLRGTRADVRLSSSGSATVWVTENLQADTSSSGRIRYYGSPAVRGGEVKGLGEKSGK